MIIKRNDIHGIYRFKDCKDELKKLGLICGGYLNSFSTEHIDLHIDNRHTITMTAPNGSVIAVLIAEGCNPAKEMAEYAKEIEDNWNKYAKEIYSR